MTRLAHQSKRYLGGASCGLLLVLGAIGAQGLGAACQSGSALSNPSPPPLPASSGGNRNTAPWTSPHEGARVAWQATTSTAPDSEPTSVAPPSASSTSIAREPAPEPSGQPAGLQQVVPTSSEFGLPIAAPPQPTEAQLQVVPGTKAAHGKSMVVSVNALATRIGIGCLSKGGNAVDAAIAVAFALAVTHPSAGNLGGGGFALVRTANGDTFALDFRESSPARLDLKRHRAMNLAKGEGPDSVAIPGTVAGLFELSKRFGSRPMAELIEPARKLAQEGHRIERREAVAIRTNWARLKESKVAATIWGKPDGTPHGEGDLVRLKALATTLQALASQGSEGFYSGTVADSIRRALGPAPQLSKDDLLDYRAIWRKPLQFRYRGLAITTMPPPSAGGIALLTALLQLERYDPRTLPHESPERAHLLLEVMRRAQADRWLSVTDPDKLSSEQRERQWAEWFDGERWVKRAPIDPNHATPNEAIIRGSSSDWKESQETTHFAVVDDSGMAVSLTTTLSSGFGSKVVTQSGIVLNNALASFSGAGANLPGPSRRTTSSMAPTLVADRDGLRLVLGTPGGDSIPSTLLQLINHLVDYQVPLDQAVDLPRLHQSCTAKGTARMEAARPPSPHLRAALARLGHRVSAPTAALGHANSIAIIAGKPYGYADPREGGLALGVPDASP